MGQNFRGTTIYCVYGKFSRVKFFQKRILKVSFIKHKVCYSTIWVWTHFLLLHTAPRCIQPIESENIIAPTPCQPCCGNQLHSNYLVVFTMTKAAENPTCQSYSALTVAHQGACTSASATRTFAPKITIAIDGSITSGSGLARETRRADNRLNHFMDKTVCRTAQTSIRVINFRGFSRKLYPREKYPLYGIFHVSFTVWGVYLHC